MAMWAEKENLNPCRRTEKKKKNSSATKKKKKRNKAKDNQRILPPFLLSVSIRLSLTMSTFSTNLFNVLAENDNTPVKVEAPAPVVVDKKNVSKLNKEGKMSF